MKTSQRGAARISVVWLIASIVVALVGAGLAFVGFDEAGKAKEDLAAARAREKTADEREIVTNDKYVNLTRAVGFSPNGDASLGANVEAIESSLAEAKSAFDLAEDVQHFEHAIPQMVTKFGDSQRKIAQVQTELASLRQELTDLRSSHSTVLSGKDAEIAKLTRELEDERTAAQDKQSQLEGQVADLRDRNNEIDAEKRQVAQKADEDSREAQKLLQAAKSRMDTQGQRLALFDAQAQTPDGNVIAVSDDLGIGWINLGSNQRLAVGTGFTVFAGTPGSKRIKGHATVLATEPDSAKVQITDLVDRYDPVVEGDVIVNPIYDPSGERFAVLAGRFSGQFNRTEISNLLAGMNVTVQDELNELTDFLIVGSELFRDPATDEPLDEPMPVSDLPVYKDAEALGGVSIIPLKDVRSYFKF